MRLSALALALAVLVACEPGTDDPVDGDTGTSDTSEPADCSVETVDEPMNGAASGAMAEQVVSGATCDGWTDEFIVNVSTGCQIQTQLTFANDQDGGGLLVAEGSLRLSYASPGGATIGTSTETSDSTTITLTNNPTDDSFGAVRIEVTHISGERLDYGLTVSTTCI